MYMSPCIQQRDASPSIRVLSLRLSGPTRSPAKFHAEGARTQPELHSLPEASTVRAKTASAAFEMILVLSEPR